MTLLLILIIIIILINTNKNNFDLSKLYKMLKNEKNPWLMNDSERNEESNYNGIIEKETKVFSFYEMIKNLFDVNNIFFNRY